jgi:glycosyltransferase involved in cell wall biosynthesis
MSKPRVLIDARMVGPRPHGFARYVSRLARGLSSLKTPYESIFIVASDTPPANFRGFRCVPASSKFLSPLEMIEIPKLLKKEGATLFHSPTFSSFPFCPCPAVSTVHDLNHLKFGSTFERIYYQAILKPFFRRAKAKLTVSEFSRGEIVAWSGVQKSEIEVVYNAIDAEFSERPADLEHRVRALGLTPGAYFLCFSNPKPHKNIPFLIQAYAKYRKELGAQEDLWPLTLSLSLSSLPELSDQPGVLALGSVSDEDSQALVHGAGAVVFPSLYEGFGLPPVEAAASGVAVVASDIAPHREGLVDVPTESVRFCSPVDLDEWSSTLHDASRGKIQGTSAEVRQRVLRRFSVERLGEHMDRIYRCVLGINS